MPTIKMQTREISCKIVYYGPGLGGKTTNMKYIFMKTNPKFKGKLVSLATETDRTLFFDFLPIAFQKVAGFDLRFQLFTVPGQVYYTESRRIILKGADGVVFVADSHPAREDANVESMGDLAKNLTFYGMTLKDIPIVIQYNKRDLENAMDVEKMRKVLNYINVPDFEAIAIRGVGVFETFNEIARMVLARVQEQLQAGKPKHEEG